MAFCDLQQFAIESADSSSAILSISNFIGHDSYVQTKNRDDYRDAPGGAFRVYNFQGNMGHFPLWQYFITLTKEASNTSAFSGQLSLDFNRECDDAILQSYVMRGAHDDEHLGRIPHLRISETDKFFGFQTGYVDGGFRAATSNVWVPKGFEPLGEAENDLSEFVNAYGNQEYLP